MLKLVKTSPGIARQRRTVKVFRDSERGYTFLCKQTNNDWSVYEGSLGAGIYAFAGGIWHNVKSLDASVLAHI